MNHLELPTKDVAAIVRATFPNYKRKTVIVRATTKVRFTDLNWSGGTRAEYAACTIDGRAGVLASQANQPAPWDNKYEGATAELRPGIVIVEGGHFCGKVARLYINVHPDDMPRFLPKPV